MPSTSSNPAPLDANKDEETPLPPPLEGLRRDGEFWIEDGNLILVAKDVAFRVYRGLLAEQSAVLAEIAAAAAASEDFVAMFDGCPVVHLSESPQDWTHLLRILLPKTRRRLHPKDERDHSPDALSALARLSHKYGIRDVKEQALDLLRASYTDNFDEWCSTYAKSTAQQAKTVFYADCIGVVNIARLTNTPSLLPAALYACSSLGASIMDGWEREDGYVEHLSTDDVKRCFDSQKRLCHERTVIMSKIFDAEPSWRCETSVKCRASLEDIVLFIMHELPILLGCAALNFSWLDDIHTEPGIFASICSICRTEVRTRETQARRDRVWGKLPDIFGVSVPGWVKNCKLRCFLRVCIRITTSISTGGREATLPGIQVKYAGEHPPDPPALPYLPIQHPSEAPYAQVVLFSPLLDALVVRVQNVKRPRGVQLYSRKDALPRSTAHPRGLAADPDVCRGGSDAEDVFDEADVLARERAPRVDAQPEVLGGQVLDGPVAPLVAVDHAALARGGEVEHVGEHRVRVREAGDVDRGDGGLRGRVAQGPEPDFAERGVLREDGGVVLLQDGEGARLEVRELVLVCEVEGGVELCEAWPGRCYPLEQSDGDGSVEYRRMTDVAPSDGEGTCGNSREI